MQEAVEGVHSTLQLEPQATPVHLGMHDLQDLLKFHLLKRVLRVKIQLCSDYQLDHLLRPGADTGHI